MYTWHHSQPQTGEMFIPPLILTNPPKQMTTRQAMVSCIVNTGSCTLWAQITQINHKVVSPYVMRFLNSDLCQISHGHQMPDVFFSLVQAWEKVSWLMFVLSSFLILLQCCCRKGSGSHQLTSHWSSTAAPDSQAPGRLSPKQISKVY